LGSLANGAAHPQLFGGGKRIKLVKAHTSGMGSGYLGFAWGLCLFFGGDAPALGSGPGLASASASVARKPGKGKSHKNRNPRALEENLH